MSLKYHYIFSGILFALIVLFGITHKTIPDVEKPIIKWSEKSVDWSNFKIVEELDEDYVATIYSTFSCPNIITDNKSLVYAYMDPNYSNRLEEADAYDLTLIHEQYHFNISEYCTRLLRKEIVEKGLGGLSFEILKQLKIKYLNKIDSLQNVYDSISDHSVNSDKQRYWELKIDDLLRQTDYYKNEDINSYYDFTKSRTKFYRHIYFTSTYKILTSYPIAEKDISYGEAYEFVYEEKDKVIKHYKNGVLTNGGYFNTAITKIVDDYNGLREIHYYNADRTYNTSLYYSYKRSILNENKNTIIQYFNELNERVNNQKVYETHWFYNQKEDAYYTTYYNKKKVKIANNEGMFHEKRVLDKKDRTIVFETLNKNYQLKNDEDYTARYELQFNKNNLKTYYKQYDESGKYALHLSDYHLKYIYDERGNTAKIISLDLNGNKTYDHNGASIYEYTYNSKNIETSTKKYNTEGIPIVGTDDYHHEVKDYDSIGRISFEAKYYPNYVLKINDSRWGASKYIYENDSVTITQNISGYNELFESKENVSIVRKVYNKKKELLKETYLNSINNFAQTSDQITEYRYKYDKNGNRIESASYDSIGQLKEFDSDVAIVKWKYDTRGNKLKTTYYNTKNKLAVTDDSVTYNFYKYNSKNQLIERTYYDIDMQPATIDGAFKTKFISNKSGLDSIEYVYNANGKLKKGVASTKYVYNKYDYLTSIEYFDSNGRRINNNHKVSIENYIYDERQNIIEYESFNTNNVLTNNDDGIAIKKWVLNKRGHTIDYMYFNNKKKPTIGPNGYHKLVQKWGVMGEISETAIYNTDLSLMEDENGTAIYRYDLKASGFRKTIKRYNKNDILANNSNGVAITNYNSSLNGLYYLKEKLTAAGEIVNDSISKSLTTDTDEN